MSLIQRVRELFWGTILIEIGTGLIIAGIGKLLVSQFLIEYLHLKIDEIPYLTAFIVILAARQIQLYIRRFFHE